MNKLLGKDLINVGIFTAIYFVVMMAIAMLGFIPIFLPSDVFLQSVEASDNTVFLQSLFYSG